MESWLLILAALFLWIIFFLATRSVREIALMILAFFRPFFANLIAAPRRFIIILLTTCFLFEALRALLAVFVTGIVDLENQETW